MTSPEPSAGRADPHSIDRLFAGWDHPDAPGGAVGVMVDGSVVHVRGYGLAHLEHTTANDERTVFHLASVSKQFTAFAILLLAADGALTLDDDVRAHLPEVPDLGASVTLRQLLHHTGGWRDQWSLLAMADWRRSDLITDADVMRMVGRQRGLNFEPGEQHRYSNTGYTLLGQVVQRVTGETLRRFCDRRIFGPLGMVDTRFRDDDREVFARRACGHTRDGGVFRMANPGYETVGATGLYSTVVDLMRWCANFERPVVGDRELLDDLQRPGELISGEPIGYALGLAVREIEGLEAVAHGGRDPGFRSGLVRLPSEGVAAVVLSNVEDDDALALAAVVALTVAGVDPGRLGSRPLPAGEVPAADPSVHVGLYRHEESGRFVRFDLTGDGELCLTVRGEQLLARPVDDRTYAVVDLPFTAVFDDDEVELTFGHGLDPSELFRRVAGVEPDRSTMAAYRGRYRSDELDSTWELDVDGVELLRRHARLPERRLYPTLADGFSDGDLRMTFERDDSDAVSGATVSDYRATGIRFSKLD